MQIVFLFWPFKNIFMIIAVNIVIHVIFIFSHDYNHSHDST